MRVQYECIPSAGCFFHSLEESGHLEGMVLSVFLQSVEESAAEKLICGHFLPVTGGICPLEAVLVG